MKLADYLSAHGISQTEFARIIQASQVAVSRYVSGHRMPGRERLLRIREATGGAVSADDFLDCVQEAAPVPAEAAQ